MKPSLPLAMVIALACCGCNINTSTTSFVRERVVQLPNGDEIYAEAKLVQRLWQPSSTEHAYVIWSRSAAAKDAAGQGGNALAKDPPRKLVMQGDLAAWDKQRGAGASDPQVHLSADGNQAWQVSEGHAIASFDYSAGTAVFGEEGQPAWATGTQ